MNKDKIRTLSGRTLDELNIEAVVAHTLSPEDVRIHGETLRRQAETAAAAGYPQLAANLRRAAELTQVSNQELLSMYEALRPGRTSYRQLLALAERLEREFNAPLTAAFVREATKAYQERGVFEARRGVNPGAEG
ncbi:MAG: glycerol dehydrogenase [Chloroflexi bacterium]|nr:glycerol dehydrogenase [Chloroflexota bacterium]